MDSTTLFASSHGEAAGDVGSAGGGRDKKLGVGLR